MASAKNSLTSKGLSTNSRLQPRLLPTTSDGAQCVPTGTLRKWEVRNSKDKLEQGRSKEWDRWAFRCASSVLGDEIRLSSLWHLKTQCLITQPLKNSSIAMQTGCQLLLCPLFNGTRTVIHHYSIPPSLTLRTLHHSLHLSGYIQGSAVDGFCCVWGLTHQM